MALQKRRNFRVLLLHAAISGLGALVVAWIYWPQLWWPAITLGLIHLAIDWLKIQLDARSSYAPLFGFVADQVAHILAIIGVLLGFGLISPQTLVAPMSLLQPSQQPILLYAFVYSTSIFFGYVLLKILLINYPRQQPPDVYLSMVERGLITTCSAIGQFPLIIAVIAPRLLLRGLRLENSMARQQLECELLVNIALGLGLGLLLYL